MKPFIEAIEYKGIEALRLNGPRGSSAVVARLGGQVLSWMTPDGRERLFLSERAVFDGSVPIRGGIPICFPQFGGLGDLPKHGFARTREWSVAAQRCGDDYALATLELVDDEDTRALWPHAFRAEITVMLEVDRIDVEFCVENTGAAISLYQRMPQLVSMNPVKQAVPSRNTLTVTFTPDWSSSFCTGPDTTTDLRALIAARRKEAWTSLIMWRPTSSSSVTWWSR